MIKTYSFGFVIIDGRNYKDDVWIDSAGKVKDWQREESHLIKNEDIKEIVKEKPEFLVVGTGAYGVVKMAEETVKFLFRLKINVIMIATGEAIKEYNRLVEEGKKVSALLHLTC